jgi:head-tail adaptor
MAVSLAKFGALGNKFLADTFSEAAQTLTISTLVETSDGQGGYTTSYITFAIVNGFIFTKSGKEPVESGRLISYQMLKIHIEYLADLQENMRITVGSTVYIIKAINDIAKAGQWQILDCERGAEE